ncbi:ribose-5-phosphate isomerase RpiA [Sphingomonas immobilis]|uniref:Ribose-5-phosphate isomerase A n=1 Tax=Sphingomonas immobilis TaxID=3063997 RepID=A0ABT8ZVV5_9SPHN|nr:ribose-5-phosphate isomerase RpiA [Sphingomonas sp. CA1-15]MDO7841696.1 ribose-5-phosphate isomerase RpiA [Sphingomonas sp. CA1-15]
MANEADKRAAALAAAEEIESGMLIGLGTGTTAAFAIARVGELVRGGLAVRAVATSLETERLARAAGIAMLDFADVPAIDLCIDGADEIDARLHAIKGGGGAMLREKIVASAALRMVVIADASKRVEAIGRAGVPVETLPFARAFVADRLESLGAEVTLRHRGGAPFATDQNNIILDCAFSAIDDPCRLADEIARIPGALGHGLFVSEVDAAYIATNGRVTRQTRPV